MRPDLGGSNDIRGVEANILETSGEEGPGRQSETSVATPLATADVEQTAIARRIEDLTGVKSDLDEHTDSMSWKDWAAEQ